MFLFLWQRCHFVDFLFSSSGIAIKNPEEEEKKETSLLPSSLSLCMARMTQSITGPSIKDEEEGKLSQGWARPM